MIGLSAFALSLHHAGVCVLCVCVCVCVCGYPAFQLFTDFHETYCRHLHWRAAQQRMSQFPTTCTNNMADARNYDMERL
jgi:hypothetical protein